MTIGPVEILVIGFPGNQFNGDVAPALADLVQSGLIRVIDPSRLRSPRTERRPEHHH